jgi:hypothetical protein
MTLKDFINKWENLPVFTDTEMSQFCGESWKVVVSGFAELEAAQREIERLKENQMTPGLEDAIDRLKDTHSEWHKLDCFPDEVRLDKAIKAVLQAAKGEQ